MESGTEWSASAERREFPDNLPAFQTNFEGSDFRNERKKMRIFIVILILKSSIIYLFFFSINFMDEKKKF